MKNDILQKLKQVRFIKIEDNERKSAYTKAVLEKLPEWFGNKQALEEYVDEVAEFPYWAALTRDNVCVGFFSVKIHYGQTGDIFVCGVLSEYQHMGIGKTLYGMAEDYFFQMGCKYIIVKTLSDMVDFEPYARTRNFYKSIGFEPLITLTEMWDEKNPCLIMIKAFC